LRALAEGGGPAAARCASAATNDLRSACRSTISAAQAAPSQALALGSAFDAMKWVDSSTASAVCVRHVSGA
jgi:hypothetical protein